MLPDHHIFNPIGSFVLLLWLDHASDWVGHLFLSDYASDCDEKSCGVRCSWSQTCRISSTRRPAWPSGSVPLLPRGFMPGSPPPWAELPVNRGSIAAVHARMDGFDLGNGCPKAVFTLTDASLPDGDDIGRVPLWAVSGPWARKVRAHNGPIPSWTSTWRPRCVMSGPGFKRPGPEPHI